MKRGPSPIAPWVLGLYVLLGALLLSGCQETDPRRKITVWHQMAVAEREVLEELAARFNERQGEIRLRVLYKETEELRSGFQSAVLAGVGPELVAGPSDALGIYQAMGILQDMSDWISPEFRAEFDDRALIELPAHDDRQRQELVFVGDRLGNHLALVFNRDFIASPPTTTTELVELAVANTEDQDGDGKPDRYGLVWNYTEPYFAVPFLTGFGGWVFDDSGAPRPALDSPEMVNALNFIKALRDEHRVLPKSVDYESAEALFVDGRAAMIINGDWSWGKYLAAANIDAAVAPLPNVSETGLPMAPMISPKGYSLSAVAKGQAVEDAMTVLKYLTGEEAQLEYLNRLKLLPSRKALQDDPRLKSDPTLRASAAQLQRGKTMPVYPELRVVWDTMRGPYQDLLAGTIEPAAAARAMQEAAEEGIQRMREPPERDGSVLILQCLLALSVGGLLWWQWPQGKRFLREFHRHRIAYLFTLPAFVVLAGTVVFPFAFNVVISLSNMSLTHYRDWEVVGLANYRSILTGEASGEFWTVFSKTIFWTVVNVVFHVAIGVLLAVLLNGVKRGQSLYRVVLIIPWAIPSYITALTWRGMFDPEFGSINMLVSQLNQLLYLPASLAIPQLDWHNAPGPAFAACIITNIWLGYPFMMVVALGGLQGIPAELYEAARIDRASAWQQFRQITLPLLKPVLLPSVTLGAIWTFNNLNVIWLVSNGGKPSDQTEILVSYVYRAVFTQYRYGVGAALSLLIFVMLLAFSIFFLRRTKAAESIY